MSTATLTEAQKSYLIGATAEFRGDLLAASRAYQHALMLDPMQHEWHFEYALVLVKLQDLGKALDHVRRSVTLNPRAAKYKQLETQLEDKIRERVGR